MTTVEYKIYGNASVADVTDFMQMLVMSSINFDYDAQENIVTVRSFRDSIFVNIDIWLNENGREIHRKRQ